MMVLRKLKRFFSSSEDPLERFALQLLRNNCMTARITPLFHATNDMGRSTRFNARLEYALSFEGVIEQKKKPQYREIYLVSRDEENRRNDILELFLYAERKMRQLKEMLPDITVEIIGLEGKPLSNAGINVIRAEARLKNVALL